MICICNPVIQVAHFVEGKRTERKINQSLLHTKPANKRILDHWKANLASAPVWETKPIEKNSVCTLTNFMKLNLNNLAVKISEYLPVYCYPLMLHTLQYCLLRGSKWETLLLFDLMWPQSASHEAACVHESVQNIHNVIHSLCQRFQPSCSHSQRIFFASHIHLIFPQFFKLLLSLFITPVF